jgi:hypothetical protein
MFSALLAKALVILRVEAGLDGLDATREFFSCFQHRRQCSILPARRARLLALGVGGAPHRHGLD